MKKCKRCGACQECGAVQPIPYPVYPYVPYTPWVNPYPNTPPPWRPTVWYGTGTNPQYAA